MSFLENRSVGQQFLAEEDQTMEQISQLMAANKCFVDTNENEWRFDPVTFRWVQRKDEPVQPSTL